MKQFLCTLLCAAAATSCWAVPAKRIFQTQTGPDGTPIEVMKVGDERSHHFVDRRGQMFVESDERLRATSQAELSQRQAFRRVPGNVGTFPGTTFPALGEQKALVILVEYKDVSFSIGSDAKAKQYFTDMLNKEGFSEYGATGSVSQYFRENSGGKFNCQFDVFGPVTLSQRRSYYGGNDRYGNDKAPEKMVVEACRALDNDIDFREYDRDGDGQVDNVYIIYAGQGEASYGSSETVWPHSWNLSEAGETLQLDGVTIDLYGCSNEWEDGKPDGMGTFTHEFSHILGLPDLYHTTSQSANYTPGEWSVLDYGPYNNDGRTPPAYSSFERNALGWINLVELTSTDDIKELDDLLTTNQAYCLTNPSNPKEFYLMETRNQQGWDKYLPAAGMLIWHVDYNSATWGQNTVNNTKSHQGVDLIEADGIAAKQNRNGGDCFPGTSAVRSHEPQWWNGKSCGITLSGITRVGTKTQFATNGSGNGSGDDPVLPPGEYYTVAGLQELNPQTAIDATIRGYIVGYADNAWTDSKVIFSATNCQTKTNLVLADSPTENNRNYCIPVQLVRNTTCQNDLNLQDNPSNLGRLVEITGKGQQYFGVAGLKTPSAYEFIEQVEINEISTETANSQLFDLQGRPVKNPCHGIFIKNGKKIFIP